MFKSIIRLVIFSCLVSCHTPEHEGPTEYRLVSLPAPVLTEGQLPYLITGADGKLYMSWIENNGDTTTFKYAFWLGDQWSEPDEIARGQHWFVNWADYPMISISAKTHMLAHYLAKSASGTYSYDVNVVAKRQGLDWSPSFVPHQDHTPTEHGFVTMLPLSDTTFQLAWLDGRNTISNGQDSAGAMTIRTAQTNLSGQLSASFELDDKVCDCCQTSSALTDKGPVVLYRNRTEDEIRDIAIVRQVNGTWTQPKSIYPDQWRIAGCPVNGPRVSAINNHLAVAWFTAAQNRPQVKLIFSNNSGKSFNEPIIIDQLEPLGRVDVILLDQEKAMISWLAKVPQGAEIKAQVVHASGVVEAPITIAPSSEVRASGFPQMAKMGDDIYFAWTHISDNEQKHLKFAALLPPYERLQP